MDEAELRTILLNRLHMEIQIFKDSMLQKEKSDIYSESFKIEMYVCLYDLLSIQAEKMEESLIRKMVYWPSGILDAFYQKWSQTEDDFYASLRDYVEDELETILADV